MKTTVIGRMDDGKTCSQRAIEERVLASIKPQLERADRLIREYNRPLETEPVQVVSPAEQAGRQIGQMVNNMREAFAAMARGFNAVSNPPPPAKPVPASQHAGMFGYIPAGVYPARRQ
jgi:hypothetical protein